MTDIICRLSLDREKGVKSILQQQQGNQFPMPPLRLSSLLSAAEGGYPASAGVVSEPDGSSLTQSVKPDGSGYLQF